MTITETASPSQRQIRLEQTKSLTNSKTTDHSTYRKLARNIGGKYAGAIGVRKAGLDALTFVDVFTTIIARESAFNPNAVSPKGAMGLGQLMPGTASDLGVSDPFDPKSNLIGSAKYFTNLLTEFGSLKLALAAYNAGPERVRKYAGIPPFKETKAYIAWILKGSGVTTRLDRPAKATGKAEQLNKDEALKGEISVWEF